MAIAKAARPHYFPAGLFGQPDTGRRAGHLRYSWVCVRWTGETSVVPRIRANDVAIQNGVYDVAEPGPAEQLWQQYEGELPAAIRALEAGTWTCSDWQTVLLHVQAQAIRHPHFTRAVHEHIGPAAAARLGPDDIQAERQCTYRDTRSWMSRARFALLRHRRPAPRFLANDKGYVPLHDIRREMRGVVFPLSWAGGRPDGRRGRPARRLRVGTLGRADAEPGGHADHQRRGVGHCADQVCLRTPGRRPGDCGPGNWREADAHARIRPIPRESGAWTFRLGE